MTKKELKKVRSSSVVKKNIQAVQYELERNLLARIYSYMFYALWGRDYNSYNTIVETNFHLPFWVLQSFRMLSFLGLVLLNSMFVYIFMKKVVYHYCFVPMVFALFAFYFLFIGSGKQKCY